MSNIFNNSSFYTISRTVIAGVCAFGQLYNSLFPKNPKFTIVSGSISGTFLKNTATIIPEYKKHGQLYTVVRVLFSPGMGDYFSFFSLYNLYISSVARRTFATGAWFLGYRK